MVEALEPFSLYDESSRSRSRRAASRSPSACRTSSARRREGAPIGGTTADAAAAAGIPAVIAEVGGCGLLEEDAVRMHLDGLAERARATSACCPGSVTPPRPDMRSVGRFVWLRSADEGWWEPVVRAGDVVACRARASDR